MDKGLMNPEDLNTLGFGKRAEYKRVDKSEEDLKKLQEGGIAGLDVKATPWFRWKVFGYKDDDDAKPS
jgi:hypothetical protein